ncbi:hypothetical protein JT358_00310 [Micrococcales bacterium 31B]|nr:hypothetical protein [Micrococcales bacterium 31B]
MSIEHSQLRCAACNEMTNHTVVYAGRLAAMVVCGGCGASTRLDVSHEYLPDLKHRIATKPMRLRERLRQDPGELARSLPRRTASKPLRLLGEMRAVWDSRKKH